MSDKVLISVPEAHETGVWSVTWSNNNIFTGSADSKTRVRHWFADPSTTPFTLVPSEPYDFKSISPLAVVSLTCSCDGKSLVAATLDGSLVFVDLEKATETLLTCDPNCGWGTCFSPVEPDTFVTTGESGKVFIYKNGRKSPTNTVQSASRCCLSLAWSPDGKFLAAGGADGTVTIFRTQNWSRHSAFSAHARAVRSIVFAGETGNLIVTGSEDGTIAVHDFGNQSRVASLTGHGGWITALACCPSKPLSLYSASTDGSVRSWDLATNAPAGVCLQSKDSVWSICLDATGTRLAAVSDDRSLSIISVA